MSVPSWQGLRRENRELFLRKASAYCQAELDRLPRLTAFIDKNRDIYGVEPICAESDRPVHLLRAQAAGART